MLQSTRFCAGLFVAVFFGGVSATAQTAPELPRSKIVAPPALVEVSRTPYSEYQATGCSSDGCTLDFSAVPSRRRVELTNVSCAFTVEATTPVVTGIAINVYNGSEFRTTEFLTPVAVGVDRPNGFLFYAVNNQILLDLDQGDFAHFGIAVVAPASMNSFGCVVHGSLITLGRAQ